MVPLIPLVTVQLSPGDAPILVTVISSKSICISKGGRGKAKTPPAPTALEITIAVVLELISEANLVVAPDKAAGTVGGKRPQKRKLTSVPSNMIVPNFSPDAAEG